MSETENQRRLKWEDDNGRALCGIARNILAIEARLAALEESSRPVQPATETAAEGANDPEREGEPQTLPPRETWPPHLRPRDEATDEPAASVAGEPMNAAEMRHALGVAREEIARLTAERDAALRKWERLKGCYEDSISVGNRMVSAMRAGRDAALREVKRLTAERDAALAEVERHRMTREERGAVSYFGMFHGSPREDDARSAPILLGLLDRTREGE